MPSLIESLLTILSAVLGAVLAAFFAVSHRNLCALISFAAGTLLGISVFHLIPEAFEFIPWPFIPIALFSGYLFFYLISRYVFHICPACAASHFEEHAAPQFRNTATLMAIALSIHILLDGVAISLGQKFGTKTAFSLFTMIAIHKFPEGLALTSLLIKAGTQKSRAILAALMIESLTLAGWASGNFFMETGLGISWLYLSLLHIGGGFVYLGLHAVINESREHSPRFVFLFFSLGSALTVVMRFLPE